MAFKIIDSVERFTALTAELGIPHAVVTCLFARGYNTASALVFSLNDSAALEETILEILKTGQAPEGGVLGPDVPDASVRKHVDAGRLRRLYSESKALVDGISAASSGGAPAALDFEGAPPPRLSHEAMVGMKKSFRTNYPSEILHDDNTPGPRYWAKVFAMLKDGKTLKWDEWTKITSIADEERIVERRGLRQPRTEVQKLLNACFEDEFEKSTADLGNNPYKLAQVFETRRMTFALCNATHLSVLRLLDVKFMSAYTKVVPHDLGLRSVNLTEAQAADKKPLDFHF